uniref:Uncharacterized protein n=1 Tax=Arundo donax TaxID=35708 RepID=A0A0A9DZ55_ARUDO
MLFLLATWLRDAKQEDGLDDGAGMHKCGVALLVCGGTCLGS